jgi:uncharacterized protein YjdB
VPKGCSGGGLASVALSQVLIVASIAACGDDSGDGAIQEPGPVTSVTITAPTTMIRVGETVQLTATARDANGTVLEGRSFEWTTGIRTVASVSPTGLVTGVGKGQSRIRATTEGVIGSIVIAVAVAPGGDPVTGCLARDRGDPVTGQRFAVGGRSPLSRR